MLDSTIVDMKAVDSTERYSVALVASGRLYRRESNSGSGCELTALRKRVNSGSEVACSLEESKTATWVRGVVDSLEESRQRFLSTNPKGVDTMRPSSMLNVDS